MDHIQAKAVFALSSYYIMLAILTLLSIQVYKLYSKTNFDLGAWLKKNIYDVLFILALVILSVFWLDPQMRVLADEMNLVQVSHSFFYTKEPLIVDQSLFSFDTWVPISWNYPIRPLMFPFVLHLFHLVFGYQLENAFILNNICFAILLGAIYFGFRYYSKRSVAAGAALLVASIPLVRLCATSAGFDLMAVTCLVLLTLVSVAILKGRKELSSLNWCLWLTYINIRYEGIALFLTAAAFFLFYARGNRRILSADLLPLFFTPIALIPLGLQFTFSQGSYENPQGTALFSVAHFFKNIFLLIRNQFQFDISLPYNHVINVLSLVLLISVLFSKKTRGLIKKNGYTIFIVGLLWSMQTAIFLAHFMGNSSMPTQFRFFLSYSVFAAVFPGMLLVLNPQLFRPAIYFVCGCLCWIFYQAQPMVVLPDQGMTKITESEYLRQFMKKNNFRNPVIVSEDPALFVGMNYSAVNFKYFDEQQKLFFKDLKTKKFSDVLLIHHEFEKNIVEPKVQEYAEKMIKDEQFKSNISLERLDFIRLNDHISIVISKAYDKN